MRIFLLLEMMMLCAALGHAADEDFIAKLRNPVYVTKNNLRDPSVLKTKDGYHVFYSRVSGKWSSKDSWQITTAFTKDFVVFENERDISPKGFASPDAPVFWGGRWVLAYQSYPTNPSRLCFSESKDLKEWSKPVFFLEEALKLQWNSAGRTIDPTFVVDGDALHCFFVGSNNSEMVNGKKTHANLIGHAITRDPALQKWEIVTKEKPMIGLSERAPDGAENCTVFKNGAEWLMVFSEGLVRQHLAVASSKDLMDWKIESAIGIEKQSWLAAKYGAPFVWRDGGRWMMILMGQDKAGRTTFGLVTSPDGRKWNLLDEKK